MFGILLSALFSALAWVVRSILVKFVVFFGLFYITTEFMGVIVPSLLPNSQSIFSAMSSLPPSMAYFMNIMQVPLGMSMIFSALVTRFIIRRIPVIG